MEDDPNSILLRLLIVFGLILLNAFFAGAEIALVSVRKTRIKQLVEEGDQRAIAIWQLLEHPTRFMATVQIGVTLVGFMASAFAAVSIAEAPAKWIAQNTNVPLATAEPACVFAVTVLVGFVTLVFGEIAPKSLAMQHSEKIALNIAKTLRLLAFLGTPFVRVVGFFSDLVVRPFGTHARFTNPILTEEELRLLVEAGEEEGVIEQDEKRMIHSIFDFGDLVARQVMVPRTDMHCASTEDTIDELLEIIMSHGHSRIPIYEDNVDNILGVVHAKDLLGIMRGGGSFDISVVMREAYFIPETKDVGELLAEFKLGKMQMAIVRDEYGGTAGLVTVEDLLEEIVGDIRDEYDMEEPLVQRIDDRMARVNARIRIDELNEQLELDVPESDEYETLGGFVFDLFGHQPEKGERIEWSYLDFIIDEVDGGRMQRITIIETDREIEVEEEKNGNGKSKAVKSEKNGKSHD